MLYTYCYDNQIIRDIIYISLSCPLARSLQMKKSFNYYVDKYDTIRFFLKIIYIFGCYNEKQLIKKMNICSKNYKNEIKRLQFYLDNKYLVQERLNKRNVTSIKTDYHDNITNLLIDSYKLKTFIPNTDLKLHFLFMEILYKLQQSGHNVVTINELAGEIKDLALDFHAEAKINVSHFYERISKLVNLGILEEHTTKSKSSNPRTYSLAPNVLEEFNTNELEEIHQLLYLFRNITPLSTLAYYIQDTLKNYIIFALGDDIASKDFFIFKDCFQWNILNDEVLLHVIYAIENHHTIRFNYINFEKPEKRPPYEGTPLKILINLADNREYIYINIDDKLCVYRLDFMRDVEIILNITDFAAIDISKCWTGAINYPPKNALETVTVVIDFFIENDSESYIFQRLLKQKRHGCIKKISPLHWEYTIDVVDYISMIPWIRSFGNHAKVHESSEHDLAERIANSWRILYGKYQN